MKELFLTYLNSTTINTVGLAFDILGAFLIWKFDLPQEISRSGTVFLVSEETNTEEIRKAKLYDKFGNLGLKLLITGFIFQAISNFI